MSTVIWMVVAVAVAAAGWFLVHMHAMAAAEDMIREFQARFPGQCVICSYHRYGVRHGLASGPVEAHAACPEAMP